MSTMYEERQYMPRKVKRRIRLVMGLMVLAFAGGLAFLYQEGQLQSGFNDWQQAGQEITKQFKSVGTLSTENGEAVK